jgi:lysozyme
MTLLGFDAVNVNTTSSAALADTKMRFVFAKSTEGQGWKAPDYANLRQRAADAGKLFGAYHYAWPNQDPLLEAQNFLGYSLLKPGEIPVLDIERQSDFPTTGLAADIKAWWERNIRYMVTWLTEVGKALGTKPVVYVNRYWRGEILKYSTLEQKTLLTGHTLWLADPTGIAGQFSDSTEWPASFHQYIMGTGIDNNWFKGDEAAWAALAIPQPPAKELTLADIQASLVQMQTAFNTSIAAVNGNVSALSTKVQELTAAAASNGSSLAELKTKTTTLSTALDTVAGKIEANSVNINTLRNDLTTKADTNQQALLDSLNVLTMNLQTVRDELATKISQIDVTIDTEALTADVSKAVEDALNGFSLTVSYPKRLA